MKPKINLRELRLPFFVLAVFCLNILIYVRALLTIEPDNIIFLECVRNSGRTSAGLNLLILFIIGHWGLKTIYNDRYKKNVFLLLFLLFAVNHLIHLFFIVQHFIAQERELLGITHNIRALITFMCIILIPLILIRFRKLNKILYAIILAHIFNVTYLISELFYARYKPFDPAYIHRIGVVIMIGSILYILYRLYAERSMKMGINDKGVTPK